MAAALVCRRSNKVILFYFLRNIKEMYSLMGEGFILLTRGYGFMGGGVYHTPFDTLKIGTSTDDIKLKLYG